MAATRLSDIAFVPEHFDQYVLQTSVEKSLLFQSGIAVDMTPQVADKLGGTTVDMPFFNDLTGDEEVVDDTQDLTISNITSGQDTAVSLYRAKVFGATDLAGDLAGSDPMNVIINRFADYWNRRHQATMLSTLAGAMGASTMSANTLNISALTGGAEFFDGDSFIDATHMLGDHNTSLAAVAVHSETEKAMKKADLIDYIKPSDGGQPIPTYMGKAVLVDDTMPFTGSGADRIYTTYIFGPGALGYATRSPKNPAEIGRDPLKNAGQDYLVHRRWFIMHPRGIRWTPGASVPAKATPSNAELAGTGNWTRVYDPKMVRIVRFVHKLPA